MQLPFFFNSWHCVFYTLKGPLSQADDLPFKWEDLLSSERTSVGLTKCSDWVTTEDDSASFAASAALLAAIF